MRKLGGPFLGSRTITSCLNEKGSENDTCSLKEGPGRSLSPRPKQGIPNLGLMVKDNDLLQVVWGPKSELLVHQKNKPKT